MKKINIKTVLSLLVLPLAFTGCEIFGLEYQTPYDYDYEIGMANPNQNMTTYEFIESRPDIFSILKDAIDYADMKAQFEMPNMTYILPTNTAFESETSSDASYFYTHQQEYYDAETDSYLTSMPTSMRAYPKQQVVDFLEYHIVKGEYYTNNIPAEPTWFETIAAADTAKVNMYIYKDRNPNLTFNNFTGHYKATVKPRTANLYAVKNSSYMHVCDSWLDRPKKDEIILK